MTVKTLIHTRSGANVGFRLLLGGHRLASSVQQLIIPHPAEQCNRFAATTELFCKTRTLGFVRLPALESEGGMGSLGKVENF